MVTIHFCETCGTKLFMGFERFPEVIGIFGGTFDDTNWFERTPDNSKYIFLETAQHGTIIPPGFNTFRQHASHNDGSPVEPKVYDEPHMVGSDKPS